MDKKRSMWYWLFHRMDWGHASAGAVFVLPGSINSLFWWLSAGLLFLFGLYEVWESIKKGDAGWPEIKGAMFGISVAGIVAATVRLFV